MHERKVEMAKRVQGFVALPGGFGTFEEVRLYVTRIKYPPQVHCTLKILEVVTWSQLGIHDKRTPSFTETLIIC